MKKVRSSQASVSINSCTELGKPIFPVSIVKQQTSTAIINRVTWLLLSDVNCASKMRNDEFILKIF